jgi:hypothetical protein
VRGEYSMYSSFRTMGSLLQAALACNSDSFWNMLGDRRIRLPSVLSFRLSFFRAPPLSVGTVASSKHHSIVGKAAPPSHRSSSRSKSLVENVRFWRIRFKGDSFISSRAAVARKLVLRFSVGKQ